MVNTLNDCIKRYTKRYLFYCMEKWRQSTQVGLGNPNLKFDHCDFEYESTPPNPEICQKKK